MREDTQHQRPRKVAVSFFSRFFFSSHVYPSDSPLGFVMLISAREPDVTTETAISYLSIQLKVDML